jgi:hypothetical protein
MDAELLGRNLSCPLPQAILGGLCFLLFDGDGIVPPFATELLLLAIDEGGSGEDCGVEDGTGLKGTLAEWAGGIGGSGDAGGVGAGGAAAF